MIEVTETGFQITSVGITLMLAFAIVVAIGSIAYFISIGQASVDARKKDASPSIGPHQLMPDGELPPVAKGPKHPGRQDHT